MNKFSKFFLVLVASTAINCYAKDTTPTPHSSVAPHLNLAPTQIGPGAKLESNPVSAIFDTKNYLYLGTANGTIWRKAHKATQWTKLNKLNSFYVNALAVDYQGTLYAGTSGGIFFIESLNFMEADVTRKARWQATPLQGVKAYILDILLSNSKLAPVSQQKLYTLVQKRGVIWEYDIVSKHWQQLPVCPNKSIFTAINVTAKNKLYAACSNGSVWQLSQQTAHYAWQSLGQTKNKRPLQMLLSEDDHIYAGSRGGRVYQYESGTWQLLPSDIQLFKKDGSIVWWLAADDWGNLYTVLDSTAVYVYNHKVWHKLMVDAWSLGKLYNGDIVIGITDGKIVRMRPSRNPALFKVLQN